ncbi:MAG: hypothetical protein U0441_32495 [Polyangiaceae bacterium]
MQSFARRAAIGILFCAGAAAGCDGSEPATDESDFTSANSKLFDFEFDGELLAATKDNPAGQIRAQLLYTVGALNAEKSVSRLGKVTLTAVTTAAADGGLFRIKYHAKLPVAWGKSTLSKTYKLTLPKRVDDAGQAAFLSKYSPACNDGEGAAINVSNFWFHYRPKAAGCSFAAGDVVTVTATTKLSPENTTAKLPEYHKIWEDGALDVVAVFGKYEEGATTLDDAGVAAYSAFVSALFDRFPGAATTPAKLPYEVGAANNDITIEVELPDGRAVRIVTLLVDKVATAPASFVSRFAEVTPGADLVLYDGHAGLGANVKALTGMAKFFPKKHQLFFLNGCDTFAYEDDSLVKARAALNPDDAAGSKYMDVMMNAMPAYFSSMPDASMAVIDALLDGDPDGGTFATYEQIFKGIDDAQTVVVTGEEDNTFAVPYTPKARWTNLEESGSVGYKETKTYVTETLQPGKYVFEMTPELGLPGGDADLFVKVGSDPQFLAANKCPSYKYNSNERCIVTIGSAAKVYLGTKGDKNGVVSSYLVRGYQPVE